MTNNNTDYFFERERHFLEQKLHVSQTTRKHMLVQLLTAEFFLRYDDCVSKRQLIGEPRLEYPINNTWCTDIFATWKTDSKTLDEIIEVQAGYMWNISFKTAEDGVKIVRALRKEGLIAEPRVKYYLGRYLPDIRIHEVENGKKHYDYYEGHISFPSNEPLDGRCVGDWVINNESEVERKVRNATELLSYRKIKDYTGPRKVDFISFAVSSKDSIRYARDISKIKNNDTVKIGCLYLYESEEIEKFDERARELVRVIGRNGCKNKKGRIQRYKEAKKELEKLEETMYVHYRKEHLPYFIQTLFVELPLNRPEYSFPFIKRIEKLNARSQT